MPRSTINGTAIDLDGKEMILDADQDTTITVDTDDRVDIKVAGTDTVHIDASGIGVNINNPLYPLHVTEASGGDTAAVFIDGPTDGTSALFMGDSDDIDIGSIQYNHSSNYMSFRTNAAESMRIDSIGAVTKPLQPAFLVHASGSQNDMTAGSTATAVLSTEVYDQNNDFASNTFTAPVDGKYFLVFTALFTDVQTEFTEIEIRINTSNRIYRLFIIPSIQLSADGSIGDSFSVVADMDASDTAIIQVTPVGGSDEMNIHSYTFFSGCLLA